MHHPAEFPFYLISPELEAIKERTAWWDKKLGPLIDHFGEGGRSIVANNVLCVEFFPYHSVKCKHPLDRLPSQDYSFGLVQRAIERQAVILIMRAKTLWFEAMPELKSYSRCCTASSVQNPVISPKNFKGFSEAVEAIKRSRLN